MQKITPFLWFDRNAEEAMNFYVSIFRNSRVVSLKRYPDGPLEGPMRGREGKVLTAVFELEGQREARDFITDNQFDPFHFGRRDVRRDSRARLIQRVSASLELVAEFRRRSNNSSFLLPSSTADEITNFVENRTSLGVRWQLNR